MRLLSWLRRHPAPATWLLVIGTALAGISLLSPLQATEIGDNVLVPIAFWASLFFVLYYSSLAPWWGNPMGRMLVGLDLSLAAITLGGVLKTEFGIQLSTAFELHLVVGAIVLADITVLSRTWLLGRLHSWVPHFPWRHKPHIYLESEGKLTVADAIDPEDVSQ